MMAVNTKRLITPLFVFLCAIAAAAGYSLRFKRELNEHWDHFKKSFGKDHIGEEEVKRRSIWEERVQNIVEHNSRADMGLHSFKRGINKYSDLSFEEVRNGLGGLKIKLIHNSYPTNAMHFGDIGVPDSVDWRHDGFVTPVKDQGNCGSCWAFSATGMLETQIRKKSGKLVSLSEQQLVDCAVLDDTPGCVAGFVDEALEYIKNHNGIPTNTTYPYQAQVGFCHNVNETAQIKIKGFGSIPTGDEEALKYAVALIGPISVSIDAGHHSFQEYKSGVYYEPFCRNRVHNLSHAVLLVGYGVENGHDYWLVKNSWGKSFGMDGYIKMSRNKGNHCGIATKAIYPLV